MKKIKHRLIMAAVCLYLVCQTVLAAEVLIPGGQLIGLEILDNTVTVAAFDEQLGAEAKKAGLQVGDRITAIDGKQVRTAEDVRDILNDAGQKVELLVLREGTVKKLQLTLHDTGDGSKLGVYLKQGVTGVGTVTWYDPQTGRFGALGHGVNEQSGSLINMQQGRVYDAAVTAVRAGRSGTPGQLLGAVSSKDPIGQLAKNTNQGVFGTIDLAAQSQALPVAEPEQVHTGAATIRSTVAGDEVQEYSVEILKVYPSSGSSGRNMLVKVTDPDLLEVTGGIVQGMSGSPIIQDGKLIGAVTHVLVNDPTTGYGIFIENMLDAAA